ncbi:MAG: phytanoyl-CoA dioxygenase family protein [Ilumatobacteraceae bacterium]
MGWLERDDLRRFAADGFLVVRDVVTGNLLDRADAEIDDLIDDVAPQEGESGPGQNAWFPPRSALPRCEDVLRRSPALEIAKELVAPNTLDHAFDHIQVARTVPPWSHLPGGPHIDGHGPGQDPPASFTVLVGVLLTDQHDSQSGNLWVWPGSHLDHERLFRLRGTKVLQRTGGHCTLLDPPATLQPQVAIRGGRGDLVLAHFLLGHNKGGNVASHDRRTIYYRLAVPGHPDRWEQTFLDAWTEYPPVREALKPAGRPTPGRASC